MRIVAVPCIRDAVAPRFEHAETISVFTIRGKVVEEKADFVLEGRDPLDRVRLLRAQRVTTLICEGVPRLFADILMATGISVISRVSGDVAELVDLFASGEHIDGSHIGFSYSLSSQPQGEV